jgi:hypothetical protein
MIDVTLNPKNPVHVGVSDRAADGCQARDLMGNTLSTRRVANHGGIAHNGFRFGVLDG